MTDDRFAIHQVVGDETQSIVILQYPGLDTGPAVLVAPLVLETELPAIPPVTVSIQVEGRAYILAMQQLSAFPKALIGPQTGNLADHEYDIQRALQRLFFGN